MTDRPIETRPEDAIAKKARPGVHDRPQEPHPFDRQAYEDSVRAWLNGGNGHEAGRPERVPLDIMRAWGLSDRPPAGVGYGDLRTRDPVDTEGYVAGKGVGRPTDAIRAQYGDDDDLDTYTYPTERALARRLPDAVVASDLLTTTSMETALQNAGYDKLSPAQAEAADIAVTQGKSLVAAMPTGSGKTVVGYLALMRCLEKGRKGIYIVPGKALAGEKVKELRGMIPKQYRVEMLTGETSDEIDDRDVLEAHSYIGEDGLSHTVLPADIIVMTPEKALVLMNHGVEWFAHVGSVVADEVHKVGDPVRGPAYEMMLSRFMERYGDTANIVALSGTVPNAKEIASWLNAEVFVSEDRAVPQKRAVYYPDGTLRYSDGDVRRTSWAGARASYNRDEITWKAAEAAMYGDGLDFDDNAQVLVFVSSKPRSEELARAFAAKVGEKAAARTMTKAEKAKEDRRIAMIDSMAAALTDGVPDDQKESVMELYRSGMAFHNAGLSRERREAIQDLYIKGAIKCIVSTPTLAEGVNLPASHVIIPDTKRGREQSDIPEDDLDQMGGRAGRFRTDNIGHVLYIPDSEDVGEADRLFDRVFCKRREKVGSQLGDERAMRTQVLGRLSNTDLANPEGTQILAGTLFGKSMPADKVQEAWKKAAEGLQDMGLAIGDGGMWRITPLGMTVARLGIQPETAMVLRKACTDEERVNAIGLCNHLDTRDLAIMHAIVCTADMDMPRFWKPEMSDEMLNNARAQLNKECRLVYEAEEVMDQDAMDANEQRNHHLLLAMALAADMRGELSGPGKKYDLSYFGLDSGGYYTAKRSAMWVARAFSDTAESCNVNLVPLLGAVEARLMTGKNLAEIIKGARDGSEICKKAMGTLPDSVYSEIKRRCGVENVTGTLSADPGAKLREDIKPLDVEAEMYDPNITMATLKKRMTWDPISEKLVASPEVRQRVAKELEAYKDLKEEDRAAVENAVLGSMTPVGSTICRGLLGHITPTANPVSYTRPLSDPVSDRAEMPLPPVDSGCWSPQLSKVAGEQLERDSSKLDKDKRFDYDEFFREGDEERGIKESAGHKDRETLSKFIRMATYDPSYFQKNKVSGNEARLAKLMLCEDGVTTGFRKDYDSPFKAWWQQVVSTYGKNGAVPPAVMDIIDREFDAVSGLEAERLLMKEYAEDNGLKWNEKSIRTTNTKRKNDFERRRIRLGKEGADIRAHEKNVADRRKTSAYTKTKSDMIAEALNKSGNDRADGQPPREAEGVFSAKRFEADGALVNMFYLYDDDVRDANGEMMRLIPKGKKIPPEFRSKMIPEVSNRARQTYWDRYLGEALTDYDKPTHAATWKRISKDDPGCIFTVPLVRYKNRNEQIKDIERMLGTVLGWYRLDFGNPMRTDKNMGRLMFDIPNLERIINEGRPDDDKIQLAPIVERIIGNSGTDGVQALMVHHDGYKEFERPDEFKLQEDEDGEEKEVPVRADIVILPDTLRSGGASAVVPGYGRSSIARAFLRRFESLGEEGKRNANAFEAWLNASSNEVTATAFMHDLGIGPVLVKFPTRDPNDLNKVSMDVIRRSMEQLKAALPGIVGKCRRTDGDIDGEAGRKPILAMPQVGTTLDGVRWGGDLKKMIMDSFGEMADRVMPVMLTDSTRYLVDGTGGIDIGSSIRIVDLSSEYFPEHIKESKTIKALHVIGNNLGLLTGGSVGAVGDNNMPSDDSRTQEAVRLVGSLTANGQAIVCGGDVGSDRISRMTARAFGGPCIVVLPKSLEYYEKAAPAFLRDICESGGLAVSIQSDGDNKRPYAELMRERDIAISELANNGLVVFRCDDPLRDGRTSIQRTKELKRKVYTVPGNTHLEKEDGIEVVDSWDRGAVMKMLADMGVSNPVMSLDDELRARLESEPTRVYPAMLQAAADMMASEETASDADGQPRNIPAEVLQLAESGQLGKYLFGSSWGDVGYDPINLSNVLNSIRDYADRPEMVAPEFVSAPIPKATQDSFDLLQPKRPPSKRANMNFRERMGAKVALTLHMMGMDPKEVDKFAGKWGYNPMLAIRAMAQLYPDQPDRLAKALKAADDHIEKVYSYGGRIRTVFDKDFDRRWIDDDYNPKAQYTVLGNTGLYKRKLIGIDGSESNRLFDKKENVDKLSKEDLAYSRGVGLVSMMLQSGRLSDLDGVVLTSSHTAGAAAAREAARRSRKGQVMLMDIPLEDLMVYADKGSDFMYYLSKKAVKNSTEEKRLKDNGVDTANLEEVDDAFKKNLFGHVVGPDGRIDLDKIYGVDMYSRDKDGKAERDSNGVLKRTHVPGIYEDGLSKLIGELDYKRRLNIDAARKNGTEIPEYIRMPIRRIKNDEELDDSNSVKIPIHPQWTFEDIFSGIMSLQSALDGGENSDLIISGVVPSIDDDEPSEEGVPKRQRFTPAEDMGSFTPAIASCAAMVGTQGGHDFERRASDLGLPMLNFVVDAGSDTPGGSELGHSQYSREDLRTLAKMSDPKAVKSFEADELKKKTGKVLIYPRELDSGTVKQWFDRPREAPQPSEGAGGGAIRSHLEDPC